MIKGAAILMMMWHHCFLKGRYEKYAISFWPLSESQVVHVASFSKYALVYLPSCLDMAYTLHIKGKRKLGRKQTGGWQGGL